LAQHDSQLVQLFLFDGSGSIQHDVASHIVFGKGNAVADTVEAGKQRYEPVQSESYAAVGWCSVSESIHEESELLFSPFFSKSENGKYFFLQLTVVDTDRSSADFHSINNDIVGIGTNGFGLVSSSGMSSGLGEVKG